MNYCTRVKVPSCDMIHMHGDSVLHCNNLTVALLRLVVVAKLCFNCSTVIFKGLNITNVFS